MDKNKFYQNDEGGLQDVPGYMNGGPGAGSPAPYQDNRYFSETSNHTGQMGGGPYSYGPQGGNGRKPKKEKSPFLTKKVAAVVLTLCVGAAAVFGFGAGTLAGRGSVPVNTGTIDSATQVANDLTSQTGGLSVAEIAQKAQDSVVEIRAEIVQTNQFMQQVSGEAAGSGVITSSDGYIVTNNHVVEGGTSFTVGLKNGETYDATLVGRDPQMDLAVLKIDAQGLTPATFGDSDALNVGETAVAIGNPLGTLGGTVTDGIISALNREINLGDGAMTLIQTNAAINPGNSGGGLFNEKGELIGVVVAKSGGTNVEGLGYAIPINDAKAVIDELINNGYVTGRVDTGMSLIDISSEQQAMMYGLEKTGVYVLKTEDGSQAQEVGIKSGDRIVAIDDQEVSSASELNKILEGHSVGDTIKVTIERSGQTASTNIKLTESVPTNS